MDAISIVSEVLPFKTNNYVVNELIEWDHYEDDPMFILNFPQEGMLKPTQFSALSNMVENHSSKSDLAEYVNEIRQTLNPHPAGQIEHQCAHAERTRSFPEFSINTGKPCCSFLPRDKPVMPTAHSVSDGRNLPDKVTINLP